MSRNLKKVQKLRLNNGFLLIEVIVYLFLFSVIIGSSVSIFYNLLESTENISEQALERDEAEFILGKINWMLNGNPEIVQPSIGMTSHKLSLIKNNFVDNPLILERIGNDILLKRGHREENILNNGQIKIEDLNFENVVISVNPHITILEVSFTIASTTYKTSQLIHE